ncbi:MAG TPA: hypothetical protein VG299_04630 [Candidatus Dormibacteraeota bacterium]|nr:hypothetical protein [Candidatus Dormibacteraeota bacterium]
MTVELVSPRLLFGVIALTLVITMAYGKRAQRRGQAQRIAAAGQED